ncbi:hypothetical protein RUND412_005876 [Rhizina undulata]
MPIAAIANGFVIGCWRELPSYLHNLAIIEERLIARSRDFSHIAKFSPTHSNTLYGFYRKIKRHVIVVVENPIPLLEILSSLDSVLGESIEVLWVGREKHSMEELTPHLQPQRDIILQALRGFIRDNPCYHDVKIDEATINSWPAVFIPPVLVDSMTVIPDVKVEKSETSTYVPGGFKAEDMDIETDDADISPGCAEVPYGDSDSLTTSSGFGRMEESSDVNIPQLIGSIIKFLKDHNSTVEDAFGGGDGDGTDPFITYWFTKKLRNSYEDNLYFMGCYLSRRRRPFKEDKTKVSLRKWVKILLKQHGRRFEKHPSFLFIAFSVYLRQTTALASKQKAKWEKIRLLLEQVIIGKFEEASENPANGRGCSNVVVLALLECVQAQGRVVPLLNSAKQIMRSELRSFQIKYGMTSVWITLNPSDLNNPLVCRFAGISLKNLSDLEKKKTQWLTHANDHENPGIFGEIDMFYFVTETNGRGAFHLHGFLWVRGNFGFKGLCERMKHNEAFADRVFKYVDTILRETLACEIAETPNAVESCRNTTTMEQDISTSMGLDTVNPQRNAHGMAF